MLNIFLKKTRIVLSLVFFFSILLSFLDLTGWLSISISRYPVYLQFIPSLFKFASLLNITAAGFIFVIILTLLGGRIYCSSICPLGTLQDFFSFIKRKLNKRKYFIYLKDYKILKYSFLALAVVSFFAGTMAFIDILDPFSNTGKIFHNILRPVLILANNSASYLLSKMNLYFLYPVEIKGFSIAAFGFSFALLVLIFIMSYTKGRLFCNSVCPVGTVLGFISKYSLIKIRIDKDKCKSCNLCEHVCKAGCIDKKSKEVDNQRCINCFNCLQVCPGNGIDYRYGFINRQSKLDRESTEEHKNFDSVDKKRRDILLRTALFAFTLSASAYAQIKIIPKKLSKIPVLKKNAVSPPGSKSIKHFNDNCTACHLCVSSCPTQVLQPSLFEYGLSGFLQPIMDYRSSYCNQDCLICGEVCPSGAILKFTKEQKKTIQTGKVQFEKRNCIVETEGTECGACSEHCPTKAVNMVPYKNRLHIPEIENKYCIGCGACEHACPVKPFKAIYVEGNPVHLKAEIRKQEKLKENIDYKEEFPF